MEVTYSGGPLDGHTAEPRRNQFSNYRHDDGKSMEPTHGNRIFHNGKKEPDRGYIYLPSSDTYLHATKFWDMLGVER